MRRWQRLLLTLVVLVLATAAAAALFGPGMLRDRAREWVRSETGRSLELGRISVNLLALSVEIRDAALTETDQTTPFAAWERLYVSLSPRSLWHRAPIIRRCQLEKPVVRIERLPDRRFNFSDLLERKETGPATPPADENPARFSLNNLEIHGGRIEFIDRTLATPTTHQVEGLELAVPFVGNLPHLEERYVQPLLRATVNGTPFELKGELKPFAEAPEYSVKLKFDGVDLPYYLGYLPETLPVTVNNGRLDVDLDLTYRAADDVEPVLELAGRLDLTAFDLRERSGRPLIFLPLLEARLAPSRPLDRQVHLAAVTFRNLQGWISRNRAGEWNVARRGGGSPPPEAVPENSREESPPLQLRIDQLRLEDGRLELRDDLPAGGFATVLKAINLAVDSFALAQNTPSRLALALTSEREEQLAVSGQFALQPLALDLSIDASGVPLAAYQPYYQTQVAAVIGGTLEAHTRLQSNDKQPLLLEEIRLDVDNLDLPLSNGDGLRLARASLQGGRFDLAGNRFEAVDLALDAAGARFSRNKEGRWSLFDRNYPVLALLAEPATAPPSPPDQAAAKPFSWRIGQITLRNGEVEFFDELPAEPARLDIAGLAVTVRDLAAPEPARSTFEVQGNFSKTGRFRITGTASPSGPEVTADLQLRRLPLTAFAPYIGERVRLALVDGALDANLTTAVAKSGENWRGRFSGDLGVSRFYCLDATHREDLLRWERLQVSGIDGRLDPPALKIAAVALNDYYARVLLDEQARLNFADLVIDRETAGEDPPSAGAAPPAAPAPEQGETPAPKPEISVGRITLQGGRVNFTDRHLPRPFSAEMLQLGGRIQGLSSVPGTLAEVDLRGRLRNESPLTITGTLNPLANPFFLDLKLDFTDIELSPLSPYSGTYVGYLIERGKLNVALTYLVENGRLTSSNKLFLDQFTFGDAVESDQATSLPVRLAVTLLKDRNGEIHLDIPVSGDLNDPQFSVWGVIWQIIKNLLVKAVTSPLTLLGALAGGGEDFSAIVFSAGSARLTEPEQAKLMKIAEALRDRPELRLEVKGYIDPELDPEGYRKDVLQAQIRREKLLDLRKRQGDAAPAEADHVVVSPEEYPDYLWRVYSAADFPKPRNLVGLVKHLPDTELEKLLLANTRVGDEELTALAQARARTVAAALTESGGIPRERVFLATSEIAALPPTAGISRSRVEFGVAVK